jgi:hypothetical protein
MTGMPKWARQADNYEKKARYREACVLLEKVLALNRRVLGEGHPSTAEGENDLAQNLRARGRYTLAQRLNEQALAVYRKTLGEEHPATAEAYIGVAQDDGLSAWDKASVPGRD